jgi:hypothetical protein
MTEKSLEQYFCKLLDKEKIFHFKGNPGGLKGYPDRLVFHDKIYFCEIKLGKEEGSYYKQTPMQKWWQEKIEASSGTYVLLVGKKEIEDFLEKIKGDN